jgi:hypothetical protein
VLVIVDIALAFAMQAAGEGYLNRFLHLHSMPQAMTANTPVLGSGMVLATRNPTPSPSPVGKLRFWNEDCK